MPDIDDLESAEDYLAWAVALWAGAKRIDPAETRGLIIPFYLLVGFALECALKAFLVHSGVPKTELKSHRLRHDLNMLFGRAIEHGFKPRPTERQIIEATSEPHREFRFRYPGGPSHPSTTRTRLRLSSHRILLDNVRQSAGIGTV